MYGIKLINCLFSFQGQASMSPPGLKDEESVTEGEEGEQDDSPDAGAGEEEEEGEKMMDLDELLKKERKREKDEQLEAPGQATVRSTDGFYL